jgi:hypothetical protein
MTFKPIKAPKRTPRPAPAIRMTAPTPSEIGKARAVLRRVLRAARWDNQGGYPGRHDGKWSFVSSSIGQVFPEELDALFAFAGVTPDEIEAVGECSDCANSDDGRERGYSVPCVSCLRPSHINHFVPRESLKRKAVRR